MAEWEALWAKQRDAIIKRIKDNKWGKSADGKTLTGPEGWTVDLTKCAAGWSDTEGLSDTSIKIGQSLSLSGTYADYGNIGKAIDFLFDYYNDQGFFKDTPRTSPARSSTSRCRRRLRRGSGDPERRRVPRLGEGLRHLDARHAGHAEDLRQDQPALRAPADRHDGALGMG